MQINNKGNSNKALILSTSMLIMVLDSVKGILNLPKTGQLLSDGEAGNPLFLTPYIERGNIAEAKRLSEVSYTKTNFNFTSYSGFFTVDTKYDSNHFFWYFPPIEADCEKKPVVVWLQGGPGTPNMFSIFVENGPLAYVKGKIEYRQYNWARQNHIVYIDNPVGAGFSFTNDPRGYCTNVTQVGEQLYSTLTQFFTVFPELQSNPLILSGESYAGKYIPALADMIHKNKVNATVRMNLQVLHIGNAWIAPEHQIGAYHKLLHNVGFLDEIQAQELKKYESEWLQAIRNEKWAEAYTFLYDFLFMNHSLLTGFTGFDSGAIYNFLSSRNYIGKRMNEYPVIFTKTLRKAIHVGNVPFDYGAKAHDHLREDVCKSVAPLLVNLLDHYYLSLYTGQLDIVVGFPIMERFLKNFDKWSVDYATGKKYVWTMDGEPAGYSKHSQSRRIMHTVFRKAGHSVCIDHPKWAWELLLQINTYF